jgi:cytochrome oxidase assembly protein ShyY1
MRFRPSIQLSLILITLAAVFLRLAIWQLDRKAEKTGLFERFAAAPSMVIEEALSGGQNMARVNAFGHYDPVRHVLLDNKIWEGRAGVQVLTPFQLADGRWLLVNRGWLPLPPDRIALPEVPTASAARTIHGRLMAPHADGLRLGPADSLASDRWPQLVTYFDADRIADALGVPLQPWVLWLDADDDSGFQDRQWSPAVMTPEVHGAYAVQWLALCATALIIWVALGLRRGALLARQADDDRSSKPASKIP